MSFLSKMKNDTMGTIAALQTVLERYPVLVTADRDTGNTSFSFMLNLLKMFGVSEENIINWLANLLADNKNGTDGVLSVIEQAIKTVILLSFKETYSCSVNPVLPDDIMLDIYDGRVRGNGIEINLEDIDAFGILSHCPTDTKGSAFYFDTNSTSGYTPLNVYSSMDFNAYLWFVINKGAFWANEAEKRKCVWDNRVLYNKLWEKEGCRRGDSVDSTSTGKGKFFNSPCRHAPLGMVSGVGPKKEIIACEFKERGKEAIGNNGKTDKLVVYLNSDRYFQTGYKGGNKTVFEFDADYIYSLKLFDTKTLIAQIVNALLGITASLQVNFSIERNVIAKKVQGIVDKIISEDDEETEHSINDCYYTFSNDEYNALLEEAMLNYNGQYQSKNEQGDNIDIDYDEILKSISDIDASADLNEEVTKITEVFKTVAQTLSSTEETPQQDKVSFGLDVIYKFMNETIIQIVLQVLSPKIMLLYAINDKILQPEEGRTMKGVQSFINDFRNLIVSMVKKIKDIILQELFDFLMGQIKPLITIFIQKLLLETLYYYKILIEQLIKACTINFNFNINRDPLQIDNVQGADIIPSQTEPEGEEGCKGM